MNLKQLLILIALVLVVGGGGLVLYRNQSASWQQANAELGKKLLQDLPINDVAHIAISQNTNALNLVRKDDSWRVQERHDYPANYGQIREFLLKAQSLKAVQTDQAGPSQLAALHLAGPGPGSNSATAVEFKDATAKTLSTLLLGKQHVSQSANPSPYGGPEQGWPDGRYIRIANSELVAVVSDPLDNIEPKPQTWLNKEFFRIEKMKSVQVDFPQATNSWKLTRDKDADPWQLAESRPEEHLDSTQTASLSYALNAPSFDDVLPGSKLEGTGTNAPTVMTIHTFDGFQYVLQVGSKTNDIYPLTVSVTAELPKEAPPPSTGEETPADKAVREREFNDRRQKLESKLKQEQAYSHWTYLVSSWTLDSLLKKRSELLTQKQNETKETDSDQPEASPVRENTTTLDDTGHKNVETPQP